MQFLIEELKTLLLKVDAETLALYELPQSLEGQLLDTFDGWKRVGVPFHQTEYVPRELSSSITLSEFLVLEENWLLTNSERGALIDKSIAGTLSDNERRRLEILQMYADYHIKKVAPRPVEILNEIERKLHSIIANKGAER